MTFRRLCLTALPLVAACAHANKNAVAAAAPPATPPPPAVVATTPLPMPVEVAPVERSCTADEQCSAKELCVSARCVSITPQMAECHASAHFDFDRSDLHPADLPLLQRVARCLVALPAERTLVDGNCDERGTVQYNIALGFRRAHAVAKYLEELGVPSGNLSEVSYGKELPLCTASTESCWATNRRADVSRGAEAREVAEQIRRDERRERQALAKPAGSELQASSAVHGPAQGRRPSRKQSAATESNPPTMK